MPSSIWGNRITNCHCALAEYMVIFTKIFMKGVPRHFRLKTMIEEYNGDAIPIVRPNFDAFNCPYDNLPFRDDTEVAQIECGRKTVTDGVGDHYKIELIETEYRAKFKIKRDTPERWSSTQPVFISAPTGQGKNYFIEHTLIPYIRELNIRYVTEFKVLILSNRLALKKQIKKRLDGEDNLDETDGKIYHYKDQADVMTYHSLLFKKDYLRKKQKSDSKSRYLFVVCDEAHFFTSDAMFNPDTKEIFDAVVSIFHNSIRIYMSATPYECLKYIANQEGQYRWLRHQSESRNELPSPVFYHFNRDYSYLDVKVYSKLDNLFDIIIRSVQKKEKWLIFIDDKAACARLKRELEEYGDKMDCPMKNLGTNDDESKIYAVSADSKQDRHFMEILKQEKLVGNTCVLISTSVLDNGVNLRNIDNIVVSNMSKVQVLQMVGRARVKRDEYTGEYLERKTLYIPRFGIREVSQRINDYTRQENCYHDLKLALDNVDMFDLRRGKNFLIKYFLGDVKDILNTRHWFMSKYNPVPHINEITRDMLDGLLPKYKAILAEMEDEERKLALPDSASAPEVGQKFLEYQLSWFGKKYCTEDDIPFSITEKAKKEFIAFLESCVGKKIYSEKSASSEDESQFMDQNEFTDKFKELYDAAYESTDRNKRTYKRNKINKLFKEQHLPYEIVSEGTPVYWIIVKTEPLELKSTADAKVEQENNIRATSDEDESPRQQSCATDMSQIDVASLIPAIRDLIRSGSLLKFSPKNRRFRRKSQGTTYGSDSKKSTY